MYQATLNDNVIVENEDTTKNMERALQRMVESGDLNADDAAEVQVYELEEQTVDTTITVKFTIY